MPPRPIPFRALTVDDLDPKQDPTLSYLNSVLQALTNQVNLQSGALGPVPVMGNLDMQGNRIINVGPAQQPTDALSTTAANPIYGKPAQQATMEAVGENMLQTTRRLNDGSQQHKTSGDLKGQGSIPPTVLGLTTYTATVSTLTVSFPTTIQYGDKSIISIPNRPIRVTGLSAGTTYFLYPYYDTTLGLGQLVADSANAVGVPPVAFPSINANAATAQYADGRVPLSSGGVSATVAGGGSGHGGGSQCLWAGMLVYERARGIVTIKSIQVGDVLLRRGGGWTTVLRRMFGGARVFIRIELSNGEELRVTASDPIALFDGTQVQAKDLTLSNLMIGCNPDFEDMPLQILNLSPLQEKGETILLTVDHPNHDFLTGMARPCVVAHNYIPIK